MNRGLNFSDAEQTTPAPIMEFAFTASKQHCCSTFYFEDSLLCVLLASTMRDINHAGLFASTHARISHGAVRRCLLNLMGYFSRVYSDAHEFLLIPMF